MKYPILVLAANEDSAVTMQVLEFESETQAEIAVEAVTSYDD